MTPPLSPLAAVWSHSVLPLGGVVFLCVDGSAHQLADGGHGCCPDALKHMTSQSNQPLAQVLTPHQSVSTSVAFGDCSKVLAIWAAAVMFSDFISSG